MNKQHLAVIILVLIALVGFGAYYYSTHKTGDEAALVAGETVTNKDLDLEFKYPGGDTGFELLQPDGTDKGILKSYLMIPKAEYQTYKTTEGATEAPAGMNVFILALPDNDATSTDATAPATTTSTSTPRMSRIAELQEWANKNSTFTSIGLAKAAPETVEIDGVKALHYQTDGLYQQDIYLVSYKNRAYMFVGQYNDLKDITYTSFQELIKSVSFQ